MCPPPHSNPAAAVVWVSVAPLALLCVCVVLCFWGQGHRWWWSVCVFLFPYFGGGGGFCVCDFQYPAFRRGGTSLISCFFIFQMHHACDECHIRALCWLSCLSLHCRAKTENPERTHPDTGRACERNQQKGPHVRGSNPHPTMSFLVWFFRILFEIFGSLHRRDFKTVHCATQAGDWCYDRCIGINRIFWILKVFWSWPLPALFKKK